MHEIPLDPFTADRLLSGVVAPEDAPPGYRDVASVLRAASGDPTEAELARQTQTVAAMSAALGTGIARSRHGRHRSQRSLRAKVSAIALVAALALGTGLAFAGTLPAAFQKVASGVLSDVGISVPNGQAASHSNDASTEAPPEAAWFGLCTAWESGQGGEKGKKNDATAFQRLSAAASKASVQGVQDFCDGVIAKHNADHSTGHGAAGQSSAAPGLSTADTKSGGRSDAGSENAHRP